MGQPTFWMKSSHVWPILLSMWRKDHSQGLRRHFQKENSLFCTFSIILSLVFVDMGWLAESQVFRMPGLCFKFSQGFEALALRRPCTGQCQAGGGACENPCPNTCANGRSTSSWGSNYRGLPTGGETCRLPTPIQGSILSPSPCSCDTNSCDTNSCDTSCTQGCGVPTSRTPQGGRKGHGASWGTTQAATEGGSAAEGSCDPCCEGGCCVSWLVQKITSGNLSWQWSLLDPRSHKSVIKWFIPTPPHTHHLFSHCQVTFVDSIKNWLSNIHHKSWHKSWPLYMDI